MCEFAVSASQGCAKFLGQAVTICGGCMLVYIIDSYSYCMLVWQSSVSNDKFTGATQSDTGRFTKKWMASMKVLESY